MTAQETRNYWENQLEMFRKSGLSVSKYCNDNGLRKNQFFYWRKRLDNKATPVFRKKTGFAPVKLLPETGMIKISLPGGISLECRSRVEPEWLSTLLRRLAD
jgi:hypothetical protein